ncbi:Histidine phosphatase superfamily,Histidine phosphatase superfamily, clade-2 [Cinara cedri]|uniref:Histidine phosphatase superfamily,Histidine phosphatase superfamily, clade-2 n=1 Tax=Cinara cedri TaxID=506608 RepID=A0A5E4MQT1_9HEMI|nr:Histidine phosphatase superfamily,Histidine phosphatase superfamily, clade-2 [Cinara cedri]
MLIRILVATVLCCSVGHTETANSCNGLYGNFSQHLASSTPYRYIANYNTTPVEFEGCNASKIWLVVRHGTRTPGKESHEFLKKRILEIHQDFINNLVEHEGNLCNADEIKSWSFNKKMNSPKWLTEEGEDELFTIAERMKLRFPQLLNKTFENTNYLFRYSNTQRAKISAQQFASGLFGRNEVEKIPLDKSLNEELLRFYEVCEKWKKDVKTSFLAALEYHKFIGSQLTNNTLKKLSSRLGLNYTLKFMDAKNIYVYCALETAWVKSKISPWCSVFDKTDLMVLEYSEDLIHYLMDGYTFELTCQQSCVLLKNMVEHFDNDDLNSKNGIFYFAHSGTVLKLLGLLKLYKDETELKHDNYFEMENRKWRTSKIDPFAANIAFVLYKYLNDSSD